MIRHHVLICQIPGKKPIARASENQDRLLVRSMPTLADSRPLTLIAVADGITNCAYGGSVARYVVERHMEQDDLSQVSRDPVGGLVDYLRGLYDRFRAEFEDSPDMLASGCTVTAAVIQGTTLSCCWIGDSPLFVLQRPTRNWTAKQITRPDVDRMGVLTDCFGHGCRGSFKSAALSLNPGDIVVAATDGACLDESLLESSMDAGAFGESWLESLALPAQGARYHDDISIVALRLPLEAE